MRERFRRYPFIWWAVLLAVALAIVLAPFLLHPGKSFIGSDDRATELITSTHASVQPWFHPIMEPGSVARQNLLLGLQAAIGLVAIAIFFAVKRRKRGE